MTDPNQIHLFDLAGLPEIPPDAPPPWPPWFSGDANSTPATHRYRVRRGLHPLGAQLAPEGHPGHGHTCGDCVHCLGRGKFYKCEPIRATHGPGTDLKLKWVACNRWEAA